MMHCDFNGFSVGILLQFGFHLLSGVTNFMDGESSKLLRFEISREGGSPPNVYSLEFGVPRSLPVKSPFFMFSGRP